MPKTAEGSAGISHHATSPERAGTPPSGDRRFRTLGWQVGLTYQTETPGGLDRDYLLRLLDEMALHRMNTLSLMMLSYGFFGAGHDGYAWPVQNPRLACYRDSAAINADPDREFVRAIIAEAATRHIEVHLFLNWGIWNQERIRTGYPHAALQHARGTPPDDWLHCPDAPDAWQLGLDEAADLLTYYRHPNVTSYAFERISYQSPSRCYCHYTQSAFLAETGRPLIEASPREIEAWKNDRIGRHLQAYTAHLRQVRPDLTVGLHTQCAPGWGHDPSRLRSQGIDYLLPHTIQFPTTCSELHAQLERLAPNRCVLHFCTRDRRPQNYDLWIKTPELISEALQWVEDYPGDNLDGILFFNEPATSSANQQAVYQGIARF